LFDFYCWVYLMDENWEFFRIDIRSCNHSFISYINQFFGWEFNVSFGEEAVTKMGFMKKLGFKWILCLIIILVLTIKEYLRVIMVLNKEEEDKSIRN
jgi:hypothetical protein